MAGKNQVTLTFAGDSRSLDRTLNNVGEGSRKAEAALEQVGSGVTQFQGRVSQSGKASEEYANRLDRLEESGGVAETRMLGLGAGISGTSALMNRGQLDAEGMAMAFADLGDFTEHTVAPALKNAKNSVGGLVEGFKSGEGAGGAFRRNIGSIAIVAAGAAAVIGLLTYAVISNAQAQEEARQRARDFADELEGTKGNLDAAINNTLRQGEEYQNLRNTLRELGVSVEEYRAGLATGDIEAWAEAHGATREQQLALILSSGMLSNAVEDGRGNFEANREAIEGTTLALRDYADELRASFDPLFAMVDAEHDFRDAQQDQLLAQQALNDAIEEHGANSTEAAEAATRLRDADTALTRSVIDLEGASTTLMAAVEDGTVSAAAAQRQFIAMATSMGVPRAEAERLATRFGFATAKAQELGRQRPKVRASLDGMEQALNRIALIRAGLFTIPPKVKTIVEIGASLTGSAGKLLSGGREHGGPVSAGRLYEVAEHGKAELLEMGARTYLIPGSDGRVVPADSGAGLRSFMNAPGGGGQTVIVNVHVAGTVLSAERDLVGMIHDAARRGAFRGVLR